MSFLVSIALINQSSRVTVDQTHALAGALNTQISRDFGQFWKIPAVSVVVADSAQSVSPDVWSLLLLDHDTENVPGALGYHELTNQDRPLGKVLVDLDVQYGYDFNTTASHEILEMLADPYAVLAAYNQNNNTLYAYECADAVQNFSYEISGIKVSDFVTPNWFLPPMQGAQYDFMKVCDAPFKVCEGGYIGYQSGNGWQIQQDEKAPQEKRGHGQGRLANRIKQHVS